MSRELYASSGDGSLEPFEYLLRAPRSPITLDIEWFSGATLDITLPTVFDGHPVDLQGVTAQISISGAAGGANIVDVKSDPGEALPEYLSFSDSQTQQAGTGTRHYQVRYDDQDGRTAIVQVGNLVLAAATAEQLALMRAARLRLDRRRAKVKGPASQAKGAQP